MSRQEIRRRAIRQQARLALLIALSAAPSYLLASDTPTQGPPVEVAPLAADAIQAPPGLSEPTVGSHTGEMVFATIAPADPADKGSTMTDAGRAGGSAAPTSAEEAKLALARAAIEASRAAGTLGGAALPEPAASVAPGDIERSKVRVMLARGASSLPIDPASGVGVDRAIQEFGPPEMTPAEIAKVEGREIPITAAPAQTPASTTDIDRLQGDGKEVLSR